MLNILTLPAAAYSQIIHRQYNSPAVPDQPIHLSPNRPTLLFRQILRFRQLQHQLLKSPSATKPAAATAISAPVKWSAFKSAADWEELSAGIRCAPVKPTALALKLILQNNPAIQSDWFRFPRKHFYRI